MNKPKNLRAATQQRFNRQALAVAETVRAWQLLREAENVSADTETAMQNLRAALEKLEYEIEKA